MTSNGRIIETAKVIIADAKLNSDGSYKVNALAIRNLHDALAKFEQEGKEFAELAFPPDSPFAPWGSKDEQPPASDVCECEICRLKRATRMVEQQKGRQ